MFCTSYIGRSLFQAASGDTEKLNVIQEHVRVSAAVLQTLNGYLDWVAMSTFIINDNLLLQMLCLLLSNTDLQMDSAECLLTIVRKKV